MAQQQRQQAVTWEILSGGLQRLVNFHLGGAIYTLPGIVVQAGVPNSFGLLLCSALLTLLVYEYLWRAAVKSQKGSLASIVAANLGRTCALVLRVLVVLNALGVITAYATTVRDIWEASAKSSSSHSMGLGELLASGPGGCFAVIVVTGACLTLLLEAKFAGVADWGSLLANGALLFLVLELAKLAWSREFPAQVMQASSSRLWSDAVTHGPNLVFAYSSAEYVLRACDVADEDGNLVKGLSSAVIKARVRTVGALSVMASSMLYVATGLVGAWAFGKGIREDVLSNLTPPSIEFAVVLAVNGLSLVLSFPVFVEALLLYLQELLQEILPRGLFEGYVKTNPFLQPSRPMTASAWVVPLACVLVAQVPGLRRAINLVSSATDYYFMFVLPPLAFFASGARGEGLVPFLLAVLGLFLAAFAAGMGANSFFDTLKDL